MNEKTKDFSQIPSNACTLIVGEFELGDNGENAKSAPVKLVARSGKAIEHWFWGRVVHDLAGMYVHKPRLPIDYVHDSKEVIGYLNRFDITSGDLVTAGALVPFKDSDRATEIIHKSKAGVPYEASINFGGDGIKIEEVAEGFITEVNGAKFEGPGVIIREWPLRGVAICPYGADANTDSSVFAGNSAKMFRASVVKAVPETTTKETDMSQESVEVAASEVTPKAEEQVKDVASEVNPVEAEVEKVEAVEAPKAVDAVPAVEASAAEVKVDDAKPVELADVKPTISREEFVKIADEFGNDVAMKIMRDGGDYQAAFAMSYDAVKKENEGLRAQIAEFNKQSHGTSVKVVAAPVDGNKHSLFNTGKK